MSLTIVCSPRKAGALCFERLSRVEVRVRAKAARPDAPDDPQRVRKVTLTFDNGPDPDGTTTAVLDLLAMQGEKIQDRRRSPIRIGSIVKGQRHLPCALGVAVLIRTHGFGPHVILHRVEPCEAQCANLPR